MGFRRYSLSFSPSWLESNLQALGFTLKEPKLLAQAVLRLSDFYQSKHRTSPWAERWAQAAYLCYFLPLNRVRLKAVLEEGRRFGFFESLESVWDFGSGPGTAALAWAECLPAVSWLNIEPSADARRLGERLCSELSANLQWSEKVPTVKKAPSLGLFSYVLNEISSLPSWAFQSEALMVVEPSTLPYARAVQSLRSTLIEKGYSLWAPCPHHEQCPLLIHSPKDWCHDRVEFVRPEWFCKIEEFLPMRNQTVTFSYLLARKAPPPVTGLARLVGDQLNEKGKTRQLVCQSSQKQYLAWLHRFGRPEPLSRGALVKLPDLRAHGAELRVEISAPVEVISQLEVSKSQKA